MSHLHLVIAALIVDMIIKPRHRHVDSQGMVYHPYISNWNPQNCNLSGLVVNVAQVFGEDPPVRQKSRSAPANPQPNYPQQPQHQQTWAAPQQPQVDPAVAKRATLTQRVQKDLESYLATTSSSIEQLMNENQTMASNRNNADREKGQLERERVRPRAG